MNGVVHGIYAIFLKAAKARWKMRWGIVIGFIIFGHR